MNETSQLREELLSKMDLFRGDKFSRAHISELMEIIDKIIDKAWKYDDLSK